MLSSGNPDVAGLVLSAMEEFARTLAGLVDRLLRLARWDGRSRTLPVPCPVKLVGELPDYA